MKGRQELLTKQAHREYSLGRISSPRIRWRGDDGQLPNVSVEQEVQVVDNQFMEGRYFEVGHHFPGKAGD